MCVLWYADDVEDCEESYSSARGYCQAMGVVRVQPKWGALAVPWHAHLTEFFGRINVMRDSRDAACPACYVLDSWQMTHWFTESYLTWWGLLCGWKRCILCPAVLASRPRWGGAAVVTVTAVATPDTRKWMGSNSVYLHGVLECQCYIWFRHEPGQCTAVRKTTAK